MHHQITGIDVFQGCLRACLARLVFPAGAAARRSGLVPAEQFRGREDGRFRFRDAEPCRKFSAKGGDGQQRGRSGADVPEAFFLPFIGEEHADIPFPVQPFPDLAFRQFTAHFLHHEVPRLKAAQGIVMDGKGEIFFPRRIFRGGGEDAYVPPFLAERGGNNQVARFDPVPQVSAPSASVSMRLTCSALRKEIWESTSNSRMDSISSSKNSRRTGWEDWRGKTSRMPPRRDHCPREMTCGTPSNPASPNCRIKSSGACVSPVFRVIPWFCMPSGDGTSSFRLPSVK